MKQTIRNIYRTLKGLNTTGTLLNEYGRKYKTDKINQNHSFAGKNYLDIYDIYFSPLKKDNITMLEIGVREGASLRTFRDYFKNGILLGLDINPETAFNEDRIKTYIGSQSSESLINKIFAENPKINIVLDDGSHVNELTIASFNLIFNKLSPGAFYIIEDLACSYLEEQLASDIVEGGWPGMNLNDSSVQMVNKRSDMNDLFFNLIKELDYRRGEVEYVHFWSQVCIIKMKDK
jgi:hypothetical protein